LDGGPQREPAASSGSPTHVRQAIAIARRFTGAAAVFLVPIGVIAIPWTAARQTLLEFKLALLVGVISLLGFLALCFATAFTARLIGLWRTAEEYEVEKRLGTYSWIRHSLRQLTVGLVGLAILLAVVLALSVVALRGPVVGDRQSPLPEGSVMTTPLQPDPLGLLTPEAPLSQTRRFVRVHATGEVSLELPANWLLPEVDPERAALPVAEAVIGPLARELLSRNPRRILKAVNPEMDLYASVTVVVNTNAAWDENQTITDDFISLMETSWRLIIGEALESGGLKVIESNPARRINSASGHAVEWDYLRTGPQGPVRVVQSFHPQVGTTATVTLSALLADWDHWWPVLSRIRASLEIGQDPFADIFRSESPTYGDQESYVATMKSDLWRLVNGQEGYFRDRLTYANRENLTSEYWLPSPLVRLDALEADASGWAAIVNHQDTPMICAIWIGKNHGLVSPAFGREEGAAYCGNP
jgi:hypothetical protein